MGATGIEPRPSLLPDHSPPLEECLPLICATSGTIYTICFFEIRGLGLHSKRNVYLGPVIEIGHARTSGG